MTAAVDLRLTHRFKSFARMAGALTLLIGGMVLMGWAFDIGTLKSIRPGLVTMKANAALAFLLAGLSLRVWQMDQPAPWLRSAGRLCALAVLVIGLLTLVEYALGWPLGIDQALFKEPFGAPETAYPGRMAAMTAVNFSLIGGALLALGKMDWLTQAGSLLVLLAALVAVIGYGYGVHALYSVPLYSTVALHTALTFAVLSLGILFSQPDRGLMALLSSKGAAGLLVRRLIPLTVCLVIGLGWLRLMGERAGWYDTAFGLALMVLSSATALSVLIWRDAKSLDEMEGKQLAAEAALRQANRELEQRIEQRSADLARADAAFRAVVETAQDAIVSADSQGRVVFWNRLAEVIFGYAAEEVVGRPLTMIMPERYRRAHEAGLQRLASTGVSRVVGTTLELIGLRKNGREFPLELSLATWKRDGAPFFTAIIRDITERKKAEERFRGLLESAPDAMVIVNNEGIVALVNSQAERLFGYTRQELLGQPVERLIPERFRAKHSSHRAGFSAAPHARSMGAGLDLWGLRKDGAEFPVEVSLSPIDAKEGGLVTAAIRDTTERKRAEEALRRANERLQALMVFKDELIDKVSHELRTPLTAVKEGVNLVRDQALGPINKEQGAFLAEVDQNIERLIELISHMLDLSKLEAGRLHLARRRVSLRGLAETTLKNYRPLAGRRVLKVELSDVPDVFADENRMLQVLGNLVSNAIKFTQDEGTICLRCHQQNQAVVLLVQDDGIGMVKEDIPKLFQKFAQVGEGRTKSRGTGLGLALCKELVELHQGTISVESELGKGSIFRLALPIYTAQLALRETFRELLESPRDQESTVGLLLVDCQSLLRQGPEKTSADLEAIATFIRAHVNRDDFVLTMEPRFVMVLAIADAFGLSAMRQRLQQRLQERALKVAGTPGPVPIGLALYPEDGQDGHSLMVKASKSVGAPIASQA